MTSSVLEPTGSQAQPFDFECYGVRLRITGNTQSLVDEAEAVARTSLLNDLRLIRSDHFDTTFEFDLDETGMIHVFDNGEEVAFNDIAEYLFLHFNSLVRAAVAERAVDRVFVHAGAVGWKGKAILLPGTSFVGKSTFVAELVRNGAVYYSDDYAIFDLDGLMHPFPRTLSMRADDHKHTRYEVTADELGGETGSEPIPVGMVLFTTYRQDAIWEPRILSPGEGALEMIPFTFSFANRPNFSLPVLNNITHHAIIVSSLRGSAKDFVKTFLDFVDKHVV